jgi:hypothetical protein
MAAISEEMLKRLRKRWTGVREASNWDVQRVEENKEVDHLEGSAASEAEERTY